MDNVAFHVFGVDVDEGSFKGAILELSRKKIIVKKLGIENVKPLYIKENPLVVTALDSRYILEREVTIPKCKQQDLLTTLSFQVEGFLPYPIEDASVRFYPITTLKKEAHYLALATKNDKIQDHLHAMISFELVPEICTAPSLALLELSKHIFLPEETSIILHLRRQSTQILLLQNAKLLASKYIPIGSSHLLTPTTIKNFQKEIEKVQFSMRSEEIHCLTLLGEAFQNDAFFQNIQKNCSYTLAKATPKPSLEITQNELLSFALPIGLALIGLPIDHHQINFLNAKELPHPLKRLKKQLWTYLIFAFIFAFVLASFHYYFIVQKEEQLANKTFSLMQWKNEFFKITPKEGPAILTNLSSTSISMKSALTDLEADDSSASYPYKLDANVPKLSHVLYWLNNLPLHKEMHIESFQYTLVKHPTKKLPQEPYQVKVDLEFKSTSAKAMKELQEAFSQPNELYYHDKDFRIIPRETTCKVSFILKNILKAPVKP